jgi:hypothetical protein
MWSDLVYQHHSYPPSATAVLHAIERELHLAGVHFQRRCLITFVDAYWCHNQADPDAGRWAREAVRAVEG